MSQLTVALILTIFLVVGADGDACVFDTYHQCIADVNLAKGTSATREQYDARVKCLEKYVFVDFIEKCEIKTSYMLFSRM